jgi:hypothetical protein
MNNSRPQPDQPHEALRQRWLVHAATAFDLMFDSRYQDQLVTFDQREQRAVELSRDLTVWLLQQHVNIRGPARRVPAHRLSQVWSPGPTGHWSRRTVAQAAADDLGRRSDPEP